MGHSKYVVYEMTVLLWPSLLYGGKCYIIRQKKLHVIYFSRAISETVKESLQ